MSILPIENEFLELLCRMCEQASLPSVLLNYDFQPIWASTSALSQWPLLQTAQAFTSVLSDYEPDTVRAEIHALGFFSTPVNTDNLFSGAGMIIYAVPKQCGNYYILQPSAKNDHGTWRQPTGLSRSIASFEAHFRSPLSMIFSSISLLHRTLHKNDLLDDYRLMLGSIHQNALLLLRSGQMIVEYTQLTNGLLPLRPERVDLYHFFRSLLTAVGKLIESTGITFSSSVPQGSFSGIADIEKITSVLLSLLSNSCRFTRSGNRIDVEVQNREDRLLVTVRDQGAGMPPSVCQRVFEPYFSYSPDGLPFAGNGLGLASAQHLTSMMGGSLALTSVEGKSTCAIFSIPVCLPISEDARIELRTELPDYLQDRFSIVHIMLADSLPPQI